MNEMLHLIWLMFCFIVIVEILKKILKLEHQKWLYRRTDTKIEKEI